MTTLVDSDNDATKLWHMRLGHAREKFMQTSAKQDLLKGVKTNKLKFCEHCVLSKKTKVKFDISILHTKGIFLCAH